MHGGPEKVHNKLRVWICASHMHGFLAQNSLNRGNSSANFP